MHLSDAQVKEHVDAIERGAFLGFESAEDIDRFTDLLVQVDDMLIVFVLLALGPESAAELAGAAMTRSDWTFGSTCFVSAAAAHLAT